MKIKTSKEDGTLLYMANNNESDSIKVFIRYGYLVVTLKMGGDVWTELESLYFVSENEWKEVEVCGFKI